MTNIENSRQRVEIKQTKRRKRDVNWIWRNANSPTFWATTYLLLIPVFGALFWHNYSSFKVGSSQETKEYQEYLSDFENELNSVARAMLASRCGNCRITEPSFALDANPSKENEGRFSVRYEDIDGVQQPLTGRFKLVLEVDKDGFGYFLLLEEFKSESIRVLPGMSIEKKALPLPEWLSETAVSGIGSAGHLITGNVSAFELLNMWSGVLDDNSRHFGTFLYLSVVTITTLGFGDIVPLDSTGRFLVAVEAVLGVVLMGLFLNAIAKNASIRSG